jgi:hypothetical protein
LTFHIGPWQIPADTRTGSLLALFASLILLGCALAIWRAGVWVSALAGKPPPAVRRIPLSFRSRSSTPAAGASDE